MSNEKKTLTLVASSDHPGALRIFTLQAQAFCDLYGDDFEFLTLRSSDDEQTDEKDFIEIVDNQIERSLVPNAGDILNALREAGFVIRRGVPEE